MKQKNRIKLLLDAALLCVLVLLYNKRALGMTFHEVGGLALLGGMAIHLLLNAKWIATVTKKLAKKETDAAQRIGWLVDLLLLCCFAAIGVSGALISHIVFSLDGGMVWKTVHYFASALSLILMGLHLGLHTALFAGVVRALRLPSRVLKPVAGVLALVIFGFGCYSVVSTSFLQWLTMPFSAATMQPGGQGGDNRPTLPEGAAPGSALPEGENTAEAPQEAPPELPNGVTAIDENAKGFGGHRMEQAGAEGGSLSGALGAMAQYFSIVFVFALLTAGSCKLAGRSKRERAAQSAPL